MTPRSTSPSSNVAWTTPPSYNNSARFLVNHFLVKKLNNGETQFLESLHIVSGAGSGLLKGIFRTAMLLFTDDNRAPHPNAPATAQELKDLYLANYSARFNKLPKLAYFGKAMKTTRCHGDSFPQHAAVQFRGPSS